MSHLKNKSKTAYDVRRYMTLVQALALKDKLKVHNGLIHLCRTWDVKWQGIAMDNLKVIPPSFVLTSLLANHVIEYHSQKEIS